jgi:hypothetical protein
MILDSPSSPKESLLTTRQLAVFHHRPLSIDLDSVENPMKLTSLPDSVTHLDELSIHEGCYYDTAISFKPDNVQSIEPGQGRSASSIISKCQFVSRAGIQLCEKSKPEYKVTQHEMQVPFTGEAKSFHAEMFEELSHYAALSLANSLFRSAVVGGTAEYPFYETVPVCFGILSVGCFGWIAAVEWIGCLYYSFVSLPFVLGSQQHQSAVELINHVSSQRKYEPVFTLPTIPSGWRKSKDKPLISFGIRKFRDREFFVKMIPVQALGSDTTTGRELGAMWLDRDHDLKEAIGELHYTHWGRAPVYFQHLHKVYSSLDSLLAANAVYPKEVVPTKLGFGMFEVAVYAPFVGTREATARDFADDGFVNTVLTTVCWLATKGNLLYVDLRPPNIRVDDSDENKYLVDYDDCVVLPAPCCCEHRVGISFAQNTQAARAIQKFSKVCDWFNGAPRCGVCAAK